MRAVYARTFADTLPRSMPARIQTKQQRAGSRPSSDAAGADIPAAFAPADHEQRIFARWEDARAFHADPQRVLAGGKPPFCILIPPPNVTGALHLGHALNNTLQDILARAARMQGCETLWMPGADHAGIATQTVVEQRVLAPQGKKRTDLSRDDFIALVQEWKDDYEERIKQQLKAMGCSCDYDRWRFTMDELCARAVREAFFQLFKAGLIYRGKRLVNWDPVAQTALADDEVEMQEIEGAFYYLRYPLVHPSPHGRGAGAEGSSSPSGTAFQAVQDKAVQPATWSDLASRGYPGADDQPPDEQASLTVATTRPETYLGDTAVAVNPKDPRAAALRGLRVQLPFVGRVIPIIEDDYVVMPAADPDAPGVDQKARFATGLLKVTPAHDQNDWEIGKRHSLPAINVLAPDATISDKHGWSDTGDAARWLSLDRFEARKRIVQAFKDAGLLEDVRPMRHTVGHSYRSHAPIEPYLSDQWYVKVTDPRLRGSAQRALVPEQRNWLPPDVSGGTAFQAVRSPASPGGTAFQAVRSPASPGGTAFQAVRSPASPGGTAFQAVRSRSANPFSTTAPRGLLPTAIDEELLPPIAPASFVPRDPYPPGEPMPSDVLGHIRKLPHIELPQATYFVTWRTRRKRALPSETERQIALDAVLHWEGERCQVYAATVLPDHVHCLVRLFEGESLASWAHSVKRHAAREINKSLGRRGRLWQEERFDHVVRDAKWFSWFVRYIVHNPVEAELCDKPSHYRWTFVHPEVAAFLQGFDSTASEAKRLRRDSLESCPAKEQERVDSLESCPTKKSENAPGDDAMRFVPPRYAKMYEAWHEGLRDWCISRQLWWGHRIPVWSMVWKGTAKKGQQLDSRRWLQIINLKGIDKNDPRFCTQVEPRPEGITVHFCIAPGADDLEAKFSDLTQDPDVLDTWFSSALWPLSTMGWPEPDASEQTRGLLDAFNPTSVLSTAREIITLWVSRMVMANRFFLGENRDDPERFIPGKHPFDEVYIHAVVQDGAGQRMSKSLGNGVDPLDIVHSHGADALRFTLCELATQTQDVRLPVDLVCPHCSEVFEPTTTKTPAGHTVQAPTQSCPKCKGEMATAYGVSAGLAQETDATPVAKNTSARFDIGRRVANKLWNAARLAISMLEAGAQERTAETVVPPDADLAELTLADRWLLDRLFHAAGDIAQAIDERRFSDYAQLLYDLIWRDFCDWHLEAIKPTARDNAAQQAVLRAALDCILRLAHPVCPFVTEAIWERLRAAAPGERSALGLALPDAELLCQADWPRVSEELRDEEAAGAFEQLRELVSAVREARAQAKVPPKARLALHMPEQLHERVAADAGLIETLAGLSRVSTEQAPAAGAIALAFETFELRLSGAETAAGAEERKAALVKQTAELNAAISRLEKRLANPGYVEKAPTHLVEQTRSELAELIRERDAAHTALENLS